MKLDTNAHSVFLLHYHLILVVKYRRQVFTDEISERAKEIFSYIAPSYKIELVEWNHDKDHVHILFKGQPKTEMSKFINAYKSASSRLLKKEFPIIRQKLWKEMFWSNLSVSYLVVEPLLKLSKNISKIKDKRNDS